MSIHFVYPCFILKLLLYRYRTIPKSRWLYSRCSGTLLFYIWMICNGPTPHPTHLLYRRARRCSCWHSIIYVKRKSWKEKSSRYKKVVKLLNNNIHHLQHIPWMSTTLHHHRHPPMSATALLIWVAYARLLQGIVKDIMVEGQLMDHQHLLLEDLMLFCHQMAE